MAIRLARLAMTVVVLGACQDAARTTADASADSAVSVDSVTSAGSSVAAAATPDLKACDVATVAELEQILGVDLEPGRTTNDYAGDSKCEWDLAGDAARGVTISLRRMSELTIYRDVPGGINAPNVGEEAVWNPTYGQLAVRQSDRVVSISLVIDQPQREHAEEIARLALARIGDSD